MQLFKPEPDEAIEPPQSGRAVAVVVSVNLWRGFDYLWPDELGDPAVGQRVRVPFGKGNRKRLAFVTHCDRRLGKRKLKAVAEVIDRQVQFTDGLWKLGEWISRYYLSPPGMTLAAMIPSAVGRHAARSETVAFLQSVPADWPGSLGGRQKRVLDELFEAKKQGVEPLALESLLHHSGASRDTIKRLRQRDLIRLESRPVRLADLPDAATAAPFDMNEDQQQVFDAMKPKLQADEFSCTLLYGVTGSGKTEVYIRAILDVIAAGRQALVMVPEIALATHTLQRLVQRLPRVAVLHSGLTDVQRAHHYRQIHEGHADVIVGPRSAVFAPAGRLGLIVVDEEHESSYKQDTAPRYHGRDVAIKRASIENIPILLGSATPSLESYHNARQGRYDLLRLDSRVRGLSMPTLQIVNLRKDIQPGRIELIGKTLTNRIAATIDRGEQIILLMNRRGYASCVFCPSCDWRFSCDHCTRLMVFHQATQLAMCHYCQHTSPLPGRCPACGKKLLYFGYGIQRIESELARKFPAVRLARMDSDTMTSPKQFQKVFDAFSAGELDLLLGTQMVAKGLDFPRVSLVGVISADTALMIPDFRSAERTFQLIEQVAGRAGRADLPGYVVVQTVNEDEPAIQFAKSHDYEGFAEYELPTRKQTNLPPFSRVIRFISRHEKLDRAEQGAELLAGRLAASFASVATMFGPQPAGVKKIRNQFRFQVLLIFSRPGAVQHILADRMEELCKDCPSEIIADVDPIMLM